MKIFLKLILIVILLMILAGISYWKYDIKREAAKDEVVRLKGKLFEHRDSLFAQQMGDTTGFYQDSLTVLDRYYEMVIDSLNRRYANMETEYTGIADSLTAETRKLSSELSEAQKKASTKKSSSSSKPKPKKKTDERAERMKADYKRLIGLLPSDLTDYEKRVAHNEVIIELSQKYQVTPEYLKKIVQ